MCPTERSSSEPLTNVTNEWWYQDLIASMAMEAREGNVWYSPSAAPTDQESQPNRNSGMPLFESQWNWVTTTLPDSSVDGSWTSTPTTSERRSRLRFMIVQSIPLNRRSKQYWKDAGGVFFRRDRSEAVIRAYQADYDAVLNLGSSEFEGDTFNIPVFNPGRVVRKLLTPGATRKEIPHLLPPAPLDLPGTAWIKRPGRGGNGKELGLVTSEMIRSLPREWDIQQHIEGKEYRVVTVGPRVVQVTQRLNPGERPRHYEWVGLTGTPMVVKNAARAGAAELGDLSVIGWDIVHSPDTDQAYILEGNTCPGVNEPTVERIVNEMRVQLEDI